MEIARVGVKPLIAMENIKQASDKTSVDKRSGSLFKKLFQKKEVVKDSSAVGKGRVSLREIDLSFKYSKEDIEAMETAKADVLQKTEESLQEIERLKSEYDQLQADLDVVQTESTKLALSLGDLKETEKNLYFDEKMAQDVVMFMINEQKTFQKKVDGSNKTLEASEKELEAVKSEYLFTKGECDCIVEKADYLTDKLNTAVHIKGITHGKLITFLDELKHIRDNMAEIHKKSKVKYYINE